jgi:putative methylase
MDRAAIERQLAACQSFEEPSARLEQYATPPDITAHIVHLAALQGDLSRRVLDLGSGTGMLTLGASLAGAEDPVGIERDSGALKLARTNARELGFADRVSWILGDATRVPVAPTEPMTVLANPPFGAVDGRSGADRAFLETIASIATVSYTVHNAGSMAFIESFVADNGGEVTRSYRAEFDIERQFEWHDSERESISVEVVRVDWE